MLRESLNSKHRIVVLEANLGLAERGDESALQRIVSSVTALEKGITRDREGWASRELEIDPLCRVLATRRPSGAEAALRAASRSERPYVPVFGALAALGDRDALVRLRAFAREGDFLDRAKAIQWLGIAKDEESRDFLRERLDDPEPEVRGAAQEALKQINQCMAS